jgi:NAD(P)-dependent dehydrogenase (short-subunit alcohol dehydrogenase family)
MRYDLHGKVALITGGAQGIGLGLAEALSLRGAKLALVDVDARGAAESAAGFGSENAIGLAADATSREALKGAIGSTVERFGRLDVVVANAGIAPAPATTRVMSPDEFERVVEVDLLGVYRTIHVALPEIVKAQGHIVLVSSVYAFLNGMLVSPYAAAKAGVEQLGRALRAELKQHGVGVTVAYFGFVDTQMVSRALDENEFGQAAQTLFPKAIAARITPAEAGEAIAHAIERRKPRVIAPRYWTALSILRGVANPAMDALLERYPKAQAILRQGDTPDHAADDMALPSARIA